VVEIVAGQELEDFIDTRISHPLDLVDTGFAVTGERAADRRTADWIAAADALSPIRDAAGPRGATE
jgi:CubicO group peptidase (beta-lactamase class C family)